MTTTDTTPESKIEAWVESTLGAKVTSIQRQARWRPLWFVKADRDGEQLGLVVRGDRGKETPLRFPLRHEMAVHKTLNEQGIRIPKVHGWIDDLGAYVMDEALGTPDMSQLDEETRRSVMREYLTQLAKMHRLPIEPFIEAGVERGATPAESGRLGMKHFIDLWRSGKREPNPLMEFFIGWLDRHPIDTKGRESIVIMDSFQFLQHEGEFQAMLDVEIGHIGDPMLDLAAPRMRDTVLNYGDLNELYATYVEVGGYELDWDALQLHHIAFTITNELAFRNAMGEASPTLDYMTDLQWCTETNMHAVEALAERLGLELVDPVIPEPTPTPTDVAHEQLVQTLRAVQSDDQDVNYHVRRAFRLARHIQRDNEIGEALRQADLDDLEPLLGYRPATWQEGTQALEDFVLADNGEHDVELVHLFHNRTFRDRVTVGPAGSAMAKHYKCQPFPNPLLATTA